MRFSPALSNAQSLIAQFLRDKRGVGAIEFAIIFPILVMLYIAAAEVTIGLSVSKRATRAASSVADIVTQQKTITKSWLGDMTGVAQSTFATYRTNGMTLKITGIAIDLLGAPKVAWSWAQDGGTPYAVNSAIATIPTDLKKPSSFLVRTELAIPYQMFTFGGSFLPAGVNTITISRTFFYRQRQGTTIDCTTC